MTPTQSPTNPHAAGKAAHTPTPWFAVRNSKYWEINTGDCDYSPSIAECCPSKCKWGEDVEAANAAFIVRACNSHEALLAFAKTFALWDSKGIIKTLAPYEGNEGGLRELARAALQSANLEAAQ